MENNEFKVGEKVLFKGTDEVVVITGFLDGLVMYETEKYSQKFGDGGACGCGYLVKLPYINNNQTN